MNTELLNIVEKELGQGTLKSKGNYAFFSPFMHHRKKKLEINFSDSNHYGIWHCWISDETGYTITSLFKRLNKSEYLTDYIWNIEKVILEKYNHSIINKPSEDYKTDILQLPKEFVSLSQLKQIDEYSANILNILSNRNISSIDIIRYNIGYCKEGKYKDRIIIPNYNENNELNFFIGRYIGDNKYTPNYLGPDVEKNKIIGFENLINFNLPITLTEGNFDAISIRFNSIPLYGKFISEKLLYKLIKYQPPIIYIILDNDAKKRMIEIAEYLSFKLLHTKIYMIFLPDEKDANKLGFEKIWHYINDNAVEYNDRFLIKNKLK